MPIRYPRVLIVDAPTAAAKVLYDFQDDTQPLATGSKTALHADTWDFGSLDLLGDPDAVGVDWGLRTVTFTQEIAGTKSAAMARQASLSKAMLRRRFWLKFQLAADTAPVWWYAYRTPPGNLSIESVYNEGAGLRDRWEIAGTIEVDPFAYSARVTLASKTVGNNPANEPGTPATGYNLPTIKGDTPSRLRIKVTPDSGPAGVGSWLVACVASSRSAPFVAIPVGTSDGLTGSTLPTGNNAAAIGGNLRTGTRAGVGAPLTVRFVAPPGSPTPRGRFLVVARTTATTATKVRYQLLNTFAGGTPLAQPTTITYADANFVWVPLGVISNGSGLPADTLTADSSTALTVDLTADATNTTDTVGIDHIILIPVDGEDVSNSTVLQLDFTYSPTNTYPLWVDGDDETSWLGGFPNSAYPIAGRGGYPTVDPAAAYNSLLILPLRNDGSTATSMTRLAGTSSVVTSYLPRATWIGDGTA